MTKIKICGLIRPEDIDSVNEASPEYIGFVFAKSRRQVTQKEARELRKKLDPGIIPVGVFVNAPIQEIQSAVDAGAIEVAQLHGQEDEEYIARLRLLCPIPVIKTIQVTSPRSFTSLQNTQADFLLLDSGAGSGHPFDWSLIPAMPKPYFLAGGISPENLGAALEVRPYGVDISSGAETDGVKDREKITRLVRRVREGTGWYSY